MRYLIVAGLGHSFGGAVLPPFFLGAHFNLVLYNTRESINGAEPFSQILRGKRLATVVTMADVPRCCQSALRLIMILIGTLFCSLLGDAMRLHLQPRIDMTPILLAPYLSVCSTFACHNIHMSYAGLAYMAASFCLSHFLTPRPLHIAPRASRT